MPWLSSSALSLLLTEFNSVKHLIHSLTQKVEDMAVSVQDIATNYADLHSVIGKMLSTLTSVEQQLQDALSAGGADQTAVQSILDSIAADKQAITDELAALPQPTTPSTPPATSSP